MKNLFINYWLFLLLGLSALESAKAQCFNTTKFPANDISAPIFSGQTVTISTTSMAGQYCVIKDLIPGKSYRFTCTGFTLITYRIVGGLVTNSPLGFGNSAYTFTAVGHNGEFHINLIAPTCGTNNTNRITTIVCNDCPPEPPKVDVGTSSLGASLDVKGEIKLSNSERPAQAGMVRWNEITNDFEGFDGNQWRSFTKSSSTWGNQPTNEGVEDAKFTASDGGGGEHFGHSVSISGDYAIVGSRFDLIGSNDLQGSAYIFHRSGTSWTEQAKLTASDGAAGDEFGISVSISGDYAIVGAWADDIGANNLQGSAYIFLRSGTSWTEQAKLTAADGATSDVFGHSVSISGDYAIIGADLCDIGANNDQGSAYIFLRSGTSWIQQAKLTAADGATSDLFGYSVSISGDYAIVGTVGDDIAANNEQGSAYIFLRSGTSWTQQAKLTASDGASLDNFGNSVSIFGDYTIVGAYRNDIDANNDQGSAYIFQRSGVSWTQQAMLTASDGAASDEFGHSVSISGDYALIGALLDDIGTTQNLGSAYIFQRSGTSWIQQARLIASDGVVDERFGFSVSISGDYAIVGTPSDDIGSNNNQGSVYLFLKK